MSQVAAGSQKADPLLQQLEELDQLMQRMLALEVIQAPAEAEHVASKDAVKEAPLAPSSSFPEFEPNAPLVETGEAVFETEPQREIELPPIIPTFVALEAAGGIAPTPVYTDFQFAPPPSVPDMEPKEAAAEVPTGFPAMEPLSAVEVIAIRAHAEPIVFVAWWLKPLAMVNRVYDGSTRWLGPIGRGLRSGPMRNLLGICGLAAALGAVAWMLWEGNDWNPT